MVIVDGLTSQEARGGRAVETLDALAETPTVDIRPNDRCTVQRKGKVHLFLLWTQGCLSSSKMAMHNNMPLLLLSRSCASAGCCGVFQQPHSRPNPSHGKSVQSADLTTIRRALLERLSGTLD